MKMAVPMIFISKHVTWSGIRYHHTFLAICSYRHSGMVPHWSLIGKRIRDCLQAVTGSNDPIPSRLLAIRIVA
jgi:hypothetical protein